MTDSTNTQSIEVLYGTGRYQARLWHLAPGAARSFPADGARKSQCLPVQGDLTVTREQESQLNPGQRVEADGQTGCEIRNSGKDTALLLEVCWGEGFTPRPLAEVTETRPWGSFTVLADEPDYKLKQLMVKPGNRLSLQRHQKREEHWLITRGDPEVTLDDRKLLLKPGDYIRIPLHSWHRIANPGLGSGEEVELIELQLGEYFGEDDIERREDDYGRV